MPACHSCRNQQQEEDHTERTGQPCLPAVARVLFVIWGAPSSRPISLEVWMSTKAETIEPAWPDTYSHPREKAKPRTAKVANTVAAATKA
jgi:hypothetical protein